MGPTSVFFFLSLYATESHLHKSSCHRSFLSVMRYSSLGLLSLATLVSASAEDPYYANLTWEAPRTLSNWSNLTVETHTGTFIGMLNDTYPNVRQFLRVPYAQVHSSFSRTILIPHIDLVFFSLPLGIYVGCLRKSRKGPGSGSILPFMAQVTPYGTHKICSSASTHILDSLSSVRDCASQFLEYLRAPQCAAQHRREIGSRLHCLVVGRRLFINGYLDACFS